MKEIHVFVSGRVQGVCFRYYTRQTARRLGIAGWVRNLADGRVEVVATGPDDAMEAFVQWLSDGPPTARVTDVEIASCERSVVRTDFDIIDSDD